MPKPAARPALNDFFKAKIDQHVHGMMSTAQVRLPIGVARVHGNVTDPVITVTMRDGTEYQWSGGRYAARKQHGCYAPLLPKPIK
jgi:hypothetical protein